MCMYAYTNTYLYSLSHFVGTLEFLTGEASSLYIDL